MNAASIALRTPKARRNFIERLSDDDVRRLLADWRFWARPEQLPPLGDWRTWLFLGGRGAGKTRAGAEFIAGEVRHARARRIALVAETLADARDVMIKGPSGLIAVARNRERPKFEPSKRLLTWPNGATALAFSAEDPDALRGPQFDCAWADELAKWRYMDETWSMLQLGLRLGERPRAVVTTTPRNRPPLIALMNDPATATTRAKTSANAANLAPSFLAFVRERYAGTRLGRQELEGELLVDVAGALWTRGMLETARVRAAPPLVRVVVAVDPTVGNGEGKQDSCGIVAAGLGADGVFYVLADRTQPGLSPAAWAARAIETFRLYEADRIVAEANQGGELVREVFRRTDPSVPVTLVHARRGKAVRAEPIAVLYEQCRVKHVGVFAELEDQMCAFSRIARFGESPDRVDALVWALTELSATAAMAAPRLRPL